jgi:hypothetical protein
MDAKNSSIYANVPIFSNISKGPQYLAGNFQQQPNLIKLIFAFTFRKNMFSHFKISKKHVLVYINFLSILGNI